MHVLFTNAQCITFGCIHKDVNSKVNQDVALATIDNYEPDPPKT